MRDNENWASEDVAAYFGDLIRANREGLKALQAWSAEMEVTIESTDMLLVLREISTDFVVGFIFERATPLGMVRLHVRRSMGILAEMLPKVQPEQRPRALRVADFLARYAPDPHTALQRAALRSGIPLELLKTPERLSPEQLEIFERSVQDILGLETLSL